MKNLPYGHCLIGVALAVVVLIALGVSPSTLGVLGVALACPLMMVVMMRTMSGRGAHGGHWDEGFTGRRDR